MSTIVSIKKQFQEASITFKEEAMPFFKHFLHFLFGKILLKSFQFITLPLLTFYIATGDMGFYQLLVGGLAIFIEVVSLGTRKFFSVQFFKETALSARLSLINQNIWVFSRVTLIFYLCLAFLLSFFLDTRHLMIAAIILVQSYLSIYNELYLSVIRNNMQFSRYNATCLAFGSLQVCLVLFLVAYSGLSLLGLALSQLITEVLQIGYSYYASQSVFKTLHRLRKKMNPADTYTMMKQSLIFIPSLLSFWLLMNIDQWMLSLMIGLNSVGLYALAMKFPLLFDYLIANSLILVYTPIIYNRMRGDFKRGLRLNCCTSVVLLLSGLIVYFICDRYHSLLKLLINQSYYPSLQYIAPLLLAACIRLATHILNLGLQFNHNIRFIVGANVAAAASNVMLNALLIPLYGVNGCLFATVLSFTVMYGVVLAKHLYLASEKKKELQAA